ncbi:MAG: DUF2795 domain-containing protein [Fibrobacter sp.]|nr:DUF2795 domain-containing protein [Fibrobacter sp.]
MSNNVNPIDVEQFLKGLNFPAQKDEIVKYANNHHASDSIINAIKTIPDHEYRSAADAARETYNKEKPDQPYGLGSCDD